MNVKRIISYGIMAIAVPALVLGGAVLFDAKKYAWLILCTVVLCCVPFFLSFEKGKSGVKQMLIIGVTVAVAVAGRFLCAALPGFKPVTAIVVLAAMYFGPEIGFMTGALSAVVSNFYFGQGMWTPFQMFIWGIIGFIGGLLALPLRRSKLLLLAYGALSGVLFSLLMDVWSVLWWEGSFNLARYITLITAALPVTVRYAVSNVVFLFLMGFLAPIFERVKAKYGL